MNRTLMTRLVGAELLKLRTVPLPRLVLLAAVSGAAALGYGLVQVAGNVGRDVDLADIVSVASQPLFFFVIVVAVVATAGEFQHRTVFATLLQAPRRATVATATAVTSAVFGAVLALLGVAAAVGGAALAMHVDGQPVTSGGAFGALGATVVIAAGWAVLGAGLGMVTRSTTVSIAALLIWKLGLEALVPMVTRNPEVAAYLPGGAADAVLQGGSHYLEPLVGGLLFAGYSAAVLLAGLAVFARRDPA